VRLEALRAIMEHRRDNPEPEPEPPKKPESVEEIMRVLEAECGQKRNRINWRNGFDELDEI
jgi:hypothetical protein